MSSVIRRDVDKYDDSGRDNEWQWWWCSKVYTFGEKGKAEESERYGLWIRKIDVPGKARCALCNVDFVYGSRGVTALTDHLKTAKHRGNYQIRKGNTSLTGSSSKFDTWYGMESAAKPSSPEKGKPVTSDEERRVNLEAMTLAFVAENNIPLANVANLVRLMQAAVQDTVGVKQMKLSDCTASYKMKYGLAATLQEPLLKELRTSFFSLNIDEATSKTNKRVLAVLVSHYSESAKKIVVHHLDAFSLTRVCAKDIYSCLESLFTKYRLPWENLISVLMDSCAVMRGSKKGLETLIRENPKCSHLLDIDGDSCHHAHNCAKKFCEQFGNHVEQMMADLHTDFKWSADLKDNLFELCQVLGITPTAPERYVSHRWLSVFDVALDTLRLFDAMTLFYFNFLSKENKVIYEDFQNEVFSRCVVSDVGKENVTRIQTYISKKQSGFTKEGKDRKRRLIQKVFVQRFKTLAILNFYVAVLPEIKKYMNFFQRKEPSMHLLHSKQHSLFNNFCGLFVKPEHLQGTPSSVNLEKEANFLSLDKMFIGSKTSEILHSKEGLGFKKGFLLVAHKTYKAAGLHLQRKMPIKNKALKMISALDPQVRCSSTAQAYLEYGTVLSSVVPDDSKDAFLKEVKAYTTCPSLSNLDTAVPIDVFWGTLMNEHIHEFPTLIKFAKALLSGFHGPLVESSFSAMGELMDKKSGRMDIETYAAIQTVRSSLAASGKDSIDTFAKKDSAHDPVDASLVKNIQTAWQNNKQRQEHNRTVMTEKQEALGCCQQNPPTKQAGKDLLLQESEADKQIHQKNLHTDRNFGPRKLQSEKQPEKRKQSSNYADSGDVVIDFEEAPPPVKKPKQAKIASFFRS